MSVGDQLAVTGVVDVLAGGRWLIVTSSGARHIVDASDLDAAPTVVRVLADGRPVDGFAAVGLRRDGQPVRVVAVTHDGPGGIAPGVVVGAGMRFALEPLAAGADVTVRWTTPVVQITRLSDTTEEIQ